MEKKKNRRPQIMWVNRAMVDQLVTYSRIECERVIIIYYIFVVVAAA